MKRIHLNHSHKPTAEAHVVDVHGKHCKAVISDGKCIVECHCDTKKVEVEVKTHRDLIDEIDTNGNGRITKKEIKAFIKKDDDK